MHTSSLLVSHRVQAVQRAVRLRCAFGLLFGMPIVCATPLLRAQSGVDTIYPLHGSVVDGVTGKPIGRALVTSTDRRLAVMTNGEGHFSVDLSVPANAGGQQPRFTSGFGRLGGGPALQLTAQRPNYLLNTQPVNILLDDSLKNKEIVLRLMPGGTLSGTVQAAGADSTRGVQVMLLRRQVADGVYAWMPAGYYSVKVEGTFRFSNLEPGEYTVMSSEWTGNPASDIDFSRVSEQYPPDFLGDTASLEGATKLRLHYGEALTAALHLRTVRYFPVTVPVQNQAQSGPLDVRIVGANSFNGFRLGWNGREGAVTGALPSGSYTLLISSYGPHPGAATVPLTVAGQALQHAPVTLASGSDIPVRVHQEFATSSDAPVGRLNTPAYLFIRPLDLGITGPVYAMRPREDGTAVIENARPGRYVVQASANRGYIAALSSGNVDLLRESFVVSDSGSADPIDITLRDDGATLNGTVDAAADASAGLVSLLLLPTDGSLQMRQGFASSEASFTLNNIPPGTYRLLALHGGSRQQQQQIPYRDREAMKAYNSKGVLVTLSAGQVASVHVALTDISEVAP